MPATDADFDLRVLLLSNPCNALLFSLSLTHLLFLSVLLYSRLRSRHSQSGQLRTVFRVSDCALCICVCVLMARALIFLLQRLRICRWGEFGALYQVFEPDACNLRIPGVARSLRQWSGKFCFVLLFSFSSLPERLLLLFDWHVSKEIYLLRFVGFGCSDLQLYVLVDSAETTGCRISRVI